MSRYNPHRDTAAIYQAADAWKQAVRHEGSVLAENKQLWTMDLLDELDRFFVQNPDEGKGTFLEKLQEQLEQASLEARQLMAELLWVTLLFPSNVGSNSKRSTIMQVWSWSGQSLPPDAPQLSDSTLNGLGSGGTAYLTQRWREIVFFIDTFRALKGTTFEQAKNLLSDGEAFGDWLAQQPGALKRQLTHILPHLLFPDLFERISSRGDKLEILGALTTEPKIIWQKRSMPEVDRALLGLRTTMEAEANQPIDFYSDELLPRWRQNGSKNSLEFAEVLSAFLTAYAGHRTEPFSINGALSQTMKRLQNWLQKCSPVASRPNLQVKISVGQGGWTKTPWIALLDKRVTTSTQRGVYAVFLIAEDLSVTYLTLNQGMTDLVAAHGQQGAAREMVRVAEEIRPRISETLVPDFSLDNHIDLRSETVAARNYQLGTIAHVALSTDALPDTPSVEANLEKLLSAYERLIEPVASVGQPGIVQVEPPAAKFTMDDLLAELFLERHELDHMLEVWTAKKNIILQGAPGVGKSFIARRLAYALIGAKTPECVQVVQFHQSYGYEDFVRGYRPAGGQGFELQDGVFFDICIRAQQDPDSTYVLIIDEINRGNLSKILGELMLLIEPDKRGADWSLRLAYSKSEEPAFFVPENLYIMGMMNTADRSLSVVDYALRRRFAFLNMRPLFDSPKFFQHLGAKGVPEGVASRIVTRMGQLNHEIESDRVNFGPGFRIGHSFFTPKEPVVDAERWYERVVQTEIHPLLEEYWYDDPSKAAQWRDRLLS